MDKPTTPGGSNPSPWPEESGSDQSFGATGVFRVVETTAPPAGSAPEPWLQELRAQEPPKPLPPPKPLAEPVVHKVVLGTGAENSPELLDRMRLASAERASVAEPPPAPASSGAGAGGFTALLRTLEEDSAAPAPAAPPAPAPRPPAQESGFTSLLLRLPRLRQYQPLPHHSVRARRHSLRKNSIREAFCIRARLQSCRKRRSMKVGL